MKKKRLLIAVLIGALLAVGATVPVLAKIMSKPGESGYVRMYHYVNVDDGNANWEATGTSSVRLTYDATVDTYTISMLVVGTKLAPKTSYTLVNITEAGYNDQDEYWATVTPLGAACTNKLGALTLKACSSDPLVDAWAVDEEGNVLSVFSRFSGADVWLVPTVAVQSDVNHPEWGTWIDLEVVDGVPQPDPSFIYAALGLPTDWNDVFHPFDYSVQP